MKKNKISVLLGVLSMLLVACGPGEPTSEATWVPAPCDENFTYESLKDVERKTSYSTYLSAMPTTLNYTKTMQAENGQHIANFVDGLVEHDRFGNLVPCIATDTGRPNEDYTEWSFTIDEAKGATWVDANGDYYADVTADDFKFVLQVVLNAATASESAYLPLLIIDGAERYMEATALFYNEYKDLESSLRYRRTISSLAGKGLIDKNATNDDLDNILNFNDVGIVVEGNTITYKLIQASDYFNTMLTYLPFLPLNRTYYNENSVYFGTGTKILYNGAYRLTTRNDTKIEYTKNASYWDADNVHVETVSYTRLGENLPLSYARDEYEAGNIDGFTLSSFDEEGWDKYVKGVDGKGTIIDPHHDLTYSQESQSVDSSFMFYLNLNRSTSNPSKLSQCSSSEISNTNKAIKYSYFREAFFDALDLEIYNARNGQETLEQQQGQINTYIPKNFVADDSGKDYYEYLVDAYSEAYNVTREQADAKLAPGQVSLSTLEDSVAKVEAAIEQLKVDDPTITYPIIIEYSSFYGDQTTKDFDELFIEATNERLNGCVTEDAFNVKNPTLKVCNGNEKVKVVPNKKILSTTNYLTVSNTFDFTLFISGWGPDYGDPMTYAHTMVQGGDLADYIGIPEKGAKFSQETQEKLDIYGEMVENANKIVSSTSEKKVQRYKAFAEAEIYMLEELALMKPLYQTGQGYSCSISNFIPYRSPRAGYGLSSNKLKGMEILNEPLSACKRKALREEWIAEKENSVK